MTEVEVIVRLKGDLESWPRVRWAHVIREEVQRTVKRVGLVLSVEDVTVRQPDPLKRDSFIKEETVRSYPGERHGEHTTQDEQGQSFRLNFPHNGVRITYQGNVIYSERFIRRIDNERFARSVLVLLLGHDPWLRRDAEGKSDFGLYGGKIEYYSAH